MILLIDNKSTFKKELVDMLKDLGAEIDIKPSNASVEELKEKTYNGVILSGGPLMLTDPGAETGVGNNTYCITSMDIPIFGICLGHHIIAKQFGSNLIYLSKMVETEREIFILEFNDIFKTLEQKIKVHEHHAICIGNIPPGFVALAYSQRRGCEALKHDEKPIYSVQFHPEVSGEIGKTILSNFLKICKEI